MTKKLELVALALWVSLGLRNCAKKPNNPVFPTDDQFPPPRDLVIVYTDREATLTWKTDDPGAVAFYRIYRRDSTETVFARIDTATNETGGRATVGIVGGPQGILLFDDGTQGDQKAGDSVYEVNYHIPQEVQVIQGKIRGDFTDRVGNLAEPVMAATQSTIQKPPDAVSLFPPTPVGAQQNALRLTWTASKDTFDFANYSIYRSQTPNFNPLAMAPIDRVTLMSITSYNDLNLQPGTTYYYRIYVYDQAGNAAGSNIGSVITAPNLPQTPVKLALPAAIDTTSLQLSWSQNNDTDFGSYQIFRAAQGEPSIHPAKQTPIASLNNNPANTLYVDRGLARKKKYTYQVFVYDKGSLYSGSNVVEGTTR